MSEQKKYDFEMLNNILNTPKNKIFGMFDEHSIYIQELQKLRKDYNIVTNSDFNIFSSISDIYYRENFHSDIIRLILDPATKKVGNSKNIELFVNLLEKIKPELKIELGGNVEVEREKRHIDILLYDDKGNAIIIENKMNFHDDEPDQIGRYYVAAGKMGLKVNAIVYLTLIPYPDTKLDKVKVRSIKNEKIRKEIEDLGLFVPISVIDKKGEINFSDHFIEECYKINSKNDISKVYYSEYNELVKHLGGNAMANTLYTDAIKEIYADEKKLDAFTSFGELWDKKDGIIKNIIKELLEKNGFNEHPNEKHIMHREVNNDVSLGFNLRDTTFGFVYMPKAKTAFSKIRDELKIILDNKKLMDIFSIDPADKDDLTVWKYIDLKKIGNFENIVANFKILEELYKEK